MAQAIELFPLVPMLWFIVTVQSTLMLKSVLFVPVYEQHPFIMPPPSEYQLFLDNPERVR